MKIDAHSIMLELRLDQTDSQVDASSILESPCDSVWQGLALNCVDLRWLVLTLVEIKLERKPTQVFHRLARQPKSTQVEWRPFVVKTIYFNTGYIALKCFFCLFCFVLFLFQWFLATCVYLRGNLRVRVATQRKSLRKFNLRPLSSPFGQDFT